MHPHGLQHARLPCPSPTPRVYSNSCHWVGGAFQPSHPLLSPSPAAFNLSQHKSIFKWVSSLHQVAKVLEFSFSISPSNEYLGLSSFRVDWLDLLAVQGTLKSLLQQHSSKASILRYSAFLMVQLSYPYMTTRLVIVFLPKRKHLLISRLQSLSAVILEPKKIKSLTVSIVFHLFAMKWLDRIPWSSFFECWLLRQLIHSLLPLSSRGSLAFLCFMP